MKRCVITGMGVVSPIGNSVPDFWTALCAGRSGIRDLTVWDASGYAYRRAGEVRDCPPLPVGMDDEELDRGARFMLVAAAEAVAQARLRERDLAPEDVAVVLSSNFGGFQQGESGFMRGADRVAVAFGFSGPRTILSLSCSSGCAALGYGMSLIRAGRARAVVTGGYDALTPFCWSGLSALRTMTQDEIRPFDRTRRGTIFSEGAGAIVLEERESARGSGVPLLAEARGYGGNNNAHHLTAPAPGGAGSARAMAAALREAGLAPEQVDHVNAHGTGTRHNDATETQAIKTVLGRHAREITLTATKSATGHMMGAAGSVECVATVMTLRDGVVPPTLHYREPDPECDLDCVPNQKRKQAVRTALSNSAGIGGCNAAVVLDQTEM